MAAAVAFPDRNMESVTSPIYGQHLLDKFREFKDEGLLCDFTIKAGHSEYRVHRAILAGCSDYFRAMFTHDMLDRNKNVMDLQTLPSSGVSALINYAYTGTLKLDMESVQDILSVASFFQAQTAIDLCVKFLKEQITFDNAEEFLTLSDLYSLEEVRQHYRKMIMKNFFKFCDTDSFLELDAKTLMEYLESDSLRAETERQLFDQVMRWYEHDKAGREEYAHLVFERVRLATDGWPLVCHASSVEPFISNEKCKKLIEDFETVMKNPNKKHLMQSHRTRVRHDVKTLVQFGGITTDDYHDNWEDDDDQPSTEMGCCRNRYFHQPLRQWLPLGCVGYMPDARAYHTMTEVNDLAIICGGRLYSEDFYLHGGTPILATKDVSLFCPDHLSLWQLKSMAEARAHHASALVDGYLYVIGGRSERGALKTMERLELETEKWSYVKGLKKTRYDHKAAGFNGLLYVTGGYEEGSGIVDTMLCFNPATKIWKHKPSMLTARTAHSMEVVGNQMYVVGGKTVENRCLSSMEVYSFELNHWTYLTPMRRECAYMATAVLNNKLLVLGGEDSVGDMLRGVQKYDFEGATWDNMCNLTEPIKAASCCAVTIRLMDDGSDPTKQCGNDEDDDMQRCMGIEEVMPPGFDVIYDEIDDDFYPMYPNDVHDYDIDDFGDEEDYVDDYIL